MGLSAGVSLAYAQQDLGSARSPGAPRDFWLANAQAGYEFREKRGSVTVSVENVLRRRFDVRPIAGGRSDLLLSELPDLGVPATVRLNF